MTATIPCFRCGTDIHLVTNDQETSLEVQMVPHTCYRFIVAEHWENGEVTACWTSEIPGKTGPDDMVRGHEQAADEGWKPPAGGHGWTYRWQIESGALRGLT